VRVLLVSAHGADTSYGGAERYVADLARGLRGRGHEAIILSAFPPHQLPNGIDAVALYASDWRTSETRRLRNHLHDAVGLPSPRVARAIDDARPDLVHTNNLPGISTTIWASARRRSLPVVHTLHDYYLLCPRTTLTRRDGTRCQPHPLLCGARTRRLRRFAHAVTDVIAGSEHLHHVHRGFFPGARNSVVRLPIVPWPGIAPRQPDALRTIGYIGGLTSIKGVRQLVDAAPALSELGVTLRLAGDGPLRPEVEAAAARGSVVYDGFVDGAAKSAFFAGCDVGVVPSEWDEPSGPPYVVCEWLAAGRPVLASERGGLAEAASTLGGVLLLEPSARGVVTAVRRLRAEQEFRAVVASVPTADASDFDRWLDEHEQIYASAMTAPVTGAAA